VNCNDYALSLLEYVNHAKSLAANHAKGRLPNRSIAAARRQVGQATQQFQLQ